MSTVKQEFKLLKNNKTKIIEFADDTFKIIQKETINRNLTTHGQITLGPCQSSPDSFIRYKMVKMGENKAKVLNGEIECVKATGSDNIDTQWIMLNQPFMNFPDTTFQNTDTFYEHQIKLTSEYKQSTSTLNILQRMWGKTGDLTLLIGKHWQVNGPRGDRNKTILVNWLGPDCINFLHTWGYSGIDDFKITGKESYQTLKCWFTLWMIKGLMNSPGFYPFLNPMEQIGIALQYPNSHVLSFDLSRPQTIMAIQVDSRSMIDDQPELIYNFGFEEMFSYFYKDQKIAIGDNSNKSSIKNLKGMSRFLLLSLWLKDVPHNNTNRILITGKTQTDQIVGREPYILDHYWSSSRVNNVGKGKSASPPNIPDRTIEAVIMREINRINFPKYEKYNLETVTIYLQLFINELVGDLKSITTLNPNKLDKIRTTLKGVLFKDSGEIIPNGLSFSKDFTQKLRFLSKIDTDEAKSKYLKDWEEDFTLYEGSNIFAQQLMNLWLVLEKEKIDNYKKFQHDLDSLASSNNAGWEMFGSIGNTTGKKTGIALLVLAAVYLMTPLVALEGLGSFVPAASFGLANWAWSNPLIVGANGVLGLFLHYVKKSFNKQSSGYQVYDSKVAKRIQAENEKYVTGRELNKSLKWLLMSFYLPIMVDDFDETVANREINSQTMRQIKTYLSVGSYEFESISFTQGVGTNIYKRHVENVNNGVKVQLEKEYVKNWKKPMKLARDAGKQAYNWIKKQIQDDKFGWDGSQDDYDNENTLAAIHSEDIQSAVRDIQHKIKNQERLGSTEYMFYLEQHPKFNSTLDPVIPDDVAREIRSTFFEHINNIRLSNNLNPIRNIEDAWIVGTTRPMSDIVQDFNTVSLDANVQIPETNFVFHRFNRQSTEPQEYFKTLDETNFQNKGCNNTVPSNPHHNSAFRIDKTGKVVASCGKDNWISDKNVPTVLPSLDAFNQRLLTSIKNMGKFWKMSLFNKIQLWKWMGIECMGVDIVNQVIGDTQSEITSKCSRASDGTELCSYDEQIQMLAKYKTIIKNSKKPRKGCGDTRQRRCIIRLKFLEKMLKSFIFYPFLRNQNDANEMWGKKTPLKSGLINANRIIVTPDWSVSGRVAFIKAGTYDIKYAKVCQIVTVDDLEANRFIPSLVRLKILDLFKSHGGGIASRNIDYHRYKIGKNNVNIVLLARYEQLPTQQDKDRFKQGVFSALDNNLPPDFQLLQNAKNNYQSLMNFGLNFNEKKILSSLLQLESTKVLTLSDFELVKKLGKRQNVGSDDADLAPLKTKQTIRNCQDPSMIPLLRERLKNMYGDSLNKDPYQMTRQEICDTLLGGSIKIDFPTIPWWSIVDVPIDLQIERGSGLIDIFTEDKFKQTQIESFLLTTYAVTLSEMKKYHEKSEQVSQSAKIKTYQQGLDSSQRADLSIGSTYKFSRFKTFALNGLDCSEYQEQDSCEHPNNLCEFKGNACTRKSISPITLVHKLFRFLKYSQSLESSNDIYFTQVSSQILVTFYNQIRKDGTVALDRLKKMSLKALKKRNFDLFKILQDMVLQDRKQVFNDRDDIFAFFKSDDFKSMNAQWQNLFIVRNDDQDGPIATISPAMSNIDTFDIFSNFYMNTIQNYGNDISNLTSLTMYTLLGLAGITKVVQFPSNVN